MEFRTIGATALLVASTVLAGCATSRSEVKLAAPQVSSAAVTKAQAVVIRNVTDERIFVDKPGDPGTPSLGGEGATKSNADIKARAIARKRNSYGQALGDVLLQNGQTVTGVMRDNVAAAFRQAGYRVAADVASAGAQPLVVDVRVKKFWSWLQPGFWSLTVHAQVETDLHLSSGGKTTTVTVKTEDPRQMVTDAVWVEVVDKALAAYRSEAVGKLSGSPF